MGTDFGETRWDEGFCDALWYVEEEEERTEGNGRKGWNGSEATYVRIVIYIHSSLYVYIYIYMCVYIGIKVGIKKGRSDGDNGRCRKWWFHSAGWRLRGEEKDRQPRS